MGKCMPEIYWIWFLFYFALAYIVWTQGDPLGSAAIFFWLWYISCRWYQRKCAAGNLGSTLFYMFCTVRAEGILCPSFGICVVSLYTLKEKHGQGSFDHTSLTVTALFWKQTREHRGVARIVKELRYTGVFNSLGRNPSGCTHSAPNSGSGLKGDDSIDPEPICCIDCTHVLQSLYLQNSPLNTWSQETVQQPHFGGYVQVLAFLIIIGGFFAFHFILWLL